MCAIFGFVANSDTARPSLRTLAQIVRANISRGPHAFGFAWLDSRGRLRMFKQCGNLNQQLPLLKMLADARMLIGHLRYATHGSPADNANNHPHPADSGWIVHNGVVSNYRHLLIERGLSPLTECDSEILGLLAEESDADTRAARIAESVETTTGNLALLGLWPRPASMLAVRRGNPLTAATATEGVYLATLPDALPPGRVKLSDNTIFRFTRRDGKVRCLTSALSETQTDDTLWQSARDGAYCGG